MDKKDFKESLNIVRKENKYKRKSKAQLIEAARRLIERGKYEQATKELLRGIWQHKNVEDTKPES